MLNLEEKAKLAQTYEPILFFHRAEKFEPLSPARYMAGSAMWCNKPVTRERTSWGNCSHSVEDPFPRDPLIPGGQLSVNGAEAGEPGRIYIGAADDDSFRPYQVSNEERELFIQQISWSQGGPNQEFFFSSENFREVDPFSEDVPSYYVEVHDQDSAAAVPRDAGTPLPPGFENAMRALYPTGYWLITYFFFSAYHEEQLTDCEIDSEVVRAKRAGELFAEHLHGSYEGDWYALAVLVANPGMPPSPGGPTTGLPPPPISPLDLADDELPQPDYVGYSRRARGVLVNIGSGVVDSRSFSLMAIASPEAGEVRFVGNHPQAFVARGTHNLYASPGNNTAPKFDSTLPLPIEVIDTCILADNFDYIFKEVEDVREQVGNAVDKGKKAGISIAKILGGAAAGALVTGPFAPIGALFGAFAGAIAAAIEGLLDPPPDSLPGQPDPAPGPNNVPDVGPSVNADDERPDFGTVAAPRGLVRELASSLGDEVIAVKPWEDHIVDRSDGVQPWWEPDGQHPNGYRGLWGARVERDPFSRRTGTRVPAYAANFLNAILTARG